MNYRVILTWAKNKNSTSSVPTYWGHFRGGKREDLMMPFFQSFSLQDFSLSDILNNSFFK